MSEQHAHPVALKPGKVLVEAECSGETSQSYSGRVEINWGSVWRWVDPATVHPASVLEDLRAEVAAYKDNHEATSKAIGAWGGYSVEESYQDNIKRMIMACDAARRDLAEALELLRPATVVANDEYKVFAWVLRKKAILARHSPDRRKGERRKWKESNADIAFFCRRHRSDRRKGSVAVDWQAKYKFQKAECDRSDLQVMEAKAECERLWEALKCAEEEARTYMNEKFTSHARAEQAEARCAELMQAMNFNHNRAVEAEAKLEKVRIVLNDRGAEITGTTLGQIAMIVLSDSPAPPAQPVSEPEPWPIFSVADAAKHWIAAVQRRIEALEQKERA